MKKTFIIISFLVIFLFPEPAHAAAQIGSGGLLDGLLNFFRGISGYVSKDPIVDVNADPALTQQNFTTYSQDNNNPNDITTRSISNNPRLYSKGQQIEDIITNFYSDPASLDINPEDDKILAAACNNTCVNISQSTSGCRDIRVSEVAYFFLTQNDTTSYDINNEVLTKKPYSPDIQDRLNRKYQNKIQLVNSQCYYQLYDQISITPKANDSNKSQENTGISDQLNKVERTIVPKTHGDQPAPPLTFFAKLANFFSGGKDEKLKDNLYKEKVFLSDLTPDKKLSTISQDENNQSLRDNFNQNMQPASWQNQTEIDSEDPSIVYKPGNPTAVVPIASLGNLTLYNFEGSSGGGCTLQRRPQRRALADECPTRDRTHP